MNRNVLPILGRGATATATCAACAVELSVHAITAGIALAALEMLMGQHGWGYDSRHRLLCPDHGGRDQLGAAC